MALRATGVSARQPGRQPTRLRATIPATYQNGVTRGVTGAIASSTDKAARFDGGNDYVDIGDPTSGVFDFGSGDFAVEAWVKPTASDERVVIGKRLLATFWLVTITDDSGHAGQVRANITNGTTLRQVYSTKRVNDGAWHHVVINFDRDTGVSIYIDGVASGTTAGASLFSVSTSGPLQIGKTTGYPNFRNDLDEIAVYPSLLSLARIQDHFHASTIDTTAPIISLATPAPGTPVTDTTPSFSGTAGHALGDSTTVTVNVYQGTEASGTPAQTLDAPRAADGTFSIDASPALTSDVEYTAQAKQSDRAGNIGTSSAVTFLVDSGTPPPGSVAIAGAGDIAWCGNGVDEQTADLLLDMPYARVFTVGDNAYPNGSTSDFANCYDPGWGRLKDRTFPAIGGHEYATPSAAGYFSYFGAAAGDPTKGYYSYDYGAWHVVVLNSQCEQVGGCAPGSAQDRWLRQDLYAHQTRMHARVLPRATVQLRREHTAAA